VVDELAALVGDEETVCDERGWLPAERRDLSLVLFKVRRATEVRELRARIPVRKAELEALTGRSERLRCARRCGPMWRGWRRWRPCRR
jgi:hypothetical protein